jgi:hypothetical protein
MATVFKNKLIQNLGTTPTVVLTSSPTANTTIIGISLANTTNDISYVSLLITDTIATTQAYYIKNINIPPNQSLRVVNGGERLVLGPSCTVTITSTVDNSLDLVMSYVEIS